MQKNSIARLSCGAACWAILLLAQEQIPAAIIGVGFDESGAAPANWNRFDASNLSLTTATPLLRDDLLAEDGSTTDVDFKLDSTYGHIRGFDNDPSADTIPSHPNPLAAVGGYFHNDSEANDTVTVTYESLAASTPYRVWVFGTRTAQTIDNLVTISGAGNPVSFRQLGTGPELYVNGELGDSSRSLQSFAVEVSSTAAGTLDIQWTEGPEAGRYAIGGLAIEKVPEPTGGMLLAAAVFMTLSVLRRGQ